jgi:hypothetical protein
MGDKYFEKDVNSPDYARDTLEFYLENGRPVWLERVRKRKYGIGSYEN